MRTNKILAKVKAGEKASGLQIPFCAPDLVELMGMAGFDYVFIDGEHGSFSPGEVEAMCRAAELAGVTPIARVPNIEPSTILRFITRGAIGIIAPHIRTKAQAQQLVNACLYSPQGMRSYGNSRGDYYGTPPITREQMQRVNAEMYICAMIEEEEGFRNLPEILKVEGLNFFKFGGHDILLDMKFDQPRMTEAIRRGAEQVRAAGKRVDADVLWEGTAGGLFLDAAKAFVAKGRGG
jgi:4-hydroxy-2-oxoheptanedioate aldolase